MTHHRKASLYSPELAAEFKSLLQSCGANKREISTLADLDPSYLTLIYRDGYVPRRPVLDRIVKAFIALGQKPEDAEMLMIYARFLPSSMLHCSREYHHEMLRNSNGSASQRKQFVIELRKDAKAKKEEATA